ncbi:MAG: hypothetical protein RL417_231 [Pseudomonadota bacterium]|jgi:hypothetical protein
MDETKSEEFPVPQTLKEFEALCKKVGIRRAMEITGITFPEEWSQSDTPSRAK